MEEKFKSLDLKLRDFSYLGGYNPSSEDREIWNEIADLKPDPDTYPHLYRWQIHLSSFTTLEKNNFPGEVTTKMVIESSNEGSNIWACQKNSFLKELEVTVTECQAASLKTASGGKGKAIKGFEVVFSDTVLFPEGGGQNDDHGTVNGLPVKRVTRKNGKAVHFIEATTPLQVGEHVLQKVDWRRRLDHMQQHSGQHLISAKFEQKFKWSTVSWWMAENDLENGKVGLSHIELNTEVIEQHQLDEVEELCNEAIREHMEVLTHIYPPESEELKWAKTRGLPEDHKGHVRVIEMGDLDKQMCCGTHVSNLSQLQMVKLLHTEKSKQKGKTLAFFLVGGRVSQYLANSYMRERELIAVLNGGPEAHASLAEKAVKNAKKYQSSTRSFMKKLANMTVEELQRTKPKYYSTHMLETEMEFCNVLLNEMANQDITLVVTMGNDKEGPCQLVIQSTDADIGKRVMDTLGAKGGGKGKRLNGKFTSLARRNDVDKLLAEYFETSKIDEE